MVSAAPVALPEGILTQRRGYKSNGEQNKAARIALQPIKSENTTTKPESVDYIMKQKLPH